MPFCWINEKNNDPAFAPALLLRAADTLGRDKNRPCVMSWSIGNENGVGKNSQTVIDFVKAHDSTRPAFISQGGYWGPQGQSFQDMHYPTPADVDNYVAKDSSKLPAQFSEQPHIFYQKDAQDFDPGASDLWSETLTRTWDKIRVAPTILGSFIWEWQNQGIADKNRDRTRDFYYGKDHLRQENNKGVVDSYRNPKPEYWIVKMAYSPIGIETRTVTPTGGTCSVALTNPLFVHRFERTDLPLGRPGRPDISANRHYAHRLRPGGFHTSLLSGSKRDDLPAAGIRTARTESLSLSRGCPCSALRPLLYLPP